MSYISPIFYHFYIYVTPYNFVAEYMPENEDEWIYDEVTLGYVMTEKSGDVTEEQWKEIVKNYYKIKALFY